MLSNQVNGRHTSAAQHRTNRSCTSQDSTVCSMPRRGLAHITRIHIRLVMLCVVLNQDHPAKNLQWAMLVPKQEDATYSAPRIAHTTLLSTLPYTSWFQNRAQTSSMIHQFQKHSTQLSKFKQTVDQLSCLPTSTSTSFADPILQHGRCRRLIILISTHWKFQIQICQELSWRGILQTSHCARLRHMWWRMMGHQIWSLNYKALLTSPPIPASW